MSAQEINENPNPQAMLGENRVSKSVKHNNKKPPMIKAYKLAYE